ncbi:ATP-binding protein [Streptomyces pseudovenezuelae]|uniref:AlbA family DNA-binding domain-containing protein n=1 Tax=Streptomyces pseudovenezuelae TaxID=67350 RepID=UPI002E322E8D|nr:ATP-binding protein [Streptomyces pseudovenezuelae]
MARSWTRLHEYLGHPPGPLTYDMVAEAVQRKLAESDDLDWKEMVPEEAKVKGEWNEFSKDVAAMANTRGGLLVYGVSDAVELVGVDLDEIDDKKLGQWLRVHLQPVVTGVSYLRLPATDGSGRDVFVVDVPASETAPHFLYGWQQKDMDKTTFNAPFRHRDDTAYMPEHQVAAAYRARFARQRAAEAALDEHVQHTTDLIAGEKDNPAAWLVVVARPTRPLPRTVPAPTRVEAKYVLAQSVKRAERALSRAVPLRGLLGPQLFPDLLDNNPGRGLRRWVDTNMLVPTRATSRRGVLVELHHDGSVATAVDLSHKAPGDGMPGSPVLPVSCPALINTVFESVALAHEHRLALRVDSPIDLRAVLTILPEADKAVRLAPVVIELGRLAIAEWGRQPKIVQPADGELAPFIDDEALAAAATELAEGLLHQFGMNILGD